MADRNLLSLDTFFRPIDGNITSAQAALYDQYITGKLDGKKLDISKIVADSAPLMTYLLQKTPASRSAMTDYSGKSWFCKWGEEKPTRLLDKWVKVITDPIACSASSSGASFTVALDTTKLAGVKVSDEIVARDTTTNKRANFLITALNKSTGAATLTLVNASPGFNVPADTKMTAIGSAHSEYGDHPATMYDDVITRFASSQIQRDAVKFSRRAMDQATTMGSYIAWQLRRMFEGHKLSLERMFFEGQRPEGYAIPALEVNQLQDAQGNRLTKTMGIFQAVTTTKLDDGTPARQVEWTNGNANISDIERSLYSLFEYKTSSTSKMLFGGIEVLHFFNNLQRQGVVQVFDQSVNSLGITVTKITFGGKSLKLMLHPIFNEAQMRNRFVVVDQANIELLDFKLPTIEAQVTGSSEFHLKEAISDLGLIIKNPETHASGIIRE